MPTGCNSVEEVEDSCNFTQIDEVKLSEVINLHPMPAASHIEISYTEDLVLHHIEIYDISGNIYHCNIENNRINISNFASGFYVARITTNMGIVRKKILKQ